MVRASNWLTVRCRHLLMRLCAEARAHDISFNEARKTRGERNLHHADGRLPIAKEARPTTLPFSLFIFPAAALAV